MNPFILVMQHSPDCDLGIFLSSNFSGGRTTNTSSNVTHFDVIDDDCYWNTPDKILIAFSSWMMRDDERNAYNMGNRIFHANYKYRFFKADTIDDIEHANKNLSSYEISEQEFIDIMMSSRAFKTVSRFISEDTSTRKEPEPVEVEIVHNKERDTWCWSSDYLRAPDKNKVKKTIPIGKGYQQSIDYISFTMGCDYNSEG